MKLKNIYITGIAGFLASHLADRFIKLGYNVSGNDTLIGGLKSNINKLVNFHNSDCCDLDEMTKNIHGSDIVIHTAASAHEGLSVFSPYFITKNNFQASTSIITASIRNNVKKFIFCSSMARYGKQQIPFKENQPPLPIDPYGIAKVASENILKNLGEVHGMKWNIAVPHNIVGPRQRYDDPYRNVISIMINRNLQGKPSIIYGDGMQKRCFSYIDDCIFCLEKLTLDDSINYETINIGPDKGTITIKELSQLIANETGFNGKPIHHKDRPNEVKYAMCSSDKARSLLNFESTTDIKYAIKKTTEWIKKNGIMKFDYSNKLEIINKKTPITWKNKLI